MKSNTQDISYYSVNYLWNPGDIIIPNFYVGSHECDIFRITKAGVIYEYEIKVSAGDLSNDRKKGIVRTNYFTGVEVKKSKDDSLLAGDRCNYFYYILPPQLINKPIPDWAGILQFDKNNTYNRFKLIRRAKRLNKLTIDIDYKKLCQSLAFRERNLRYKYLRLKNR